MGELVQLFFDLRGEIGLRTWQHVQLVAVSVVIATANPFAHQWRDELMQLLRKEIIMVLASPLEIARYTEEFYQLDIRIDKTFVFDDWSLKLYLELSNATNRANIEQVGYSFDYSTRSDIVGLPIVPGLGIRATF